MYIATARAIALARRRGGGPPRSWRRPRTSPPAPPPWPRGAIRGRGARDDVDPIPFCYFVLIAMEMHCV